MVINNRFARFLTAAELPVVLALSPALLFPTPTRLLALAVVPILWGAARRTTGRLVPVTPMNPAIWLMLGMVGVSLFVTFDRTFSLGKVSGVLLGTLLFWAAVRWLNTSTRLQLATAGFVIAGALLAVAGLLGTEASYKFPALGMATARLPRVIRGIPGAEDGFNANAVAGCLVLFVPLQVALLATRGHRWLCRSRGNRIDKSLVLIQVALLALTAGTVVVMQCRGAWAGLLIAGLAFLLWCRRTRALGIVVLAVAVVAAAALGPTRVVGVLLMGSGVGQTAAARVGLWERGIYGIQDFPFTGMGMNAFRRVMPVMYPPFLTPADVDMAHAHNHLLQVALDLGIPGLVAYLSLWLEAAVLLTVLYRRSPVRIYRALAGGLGAGLIAHFVFGMTDAIPMGAKVGVLFWLALTLTVGLHRVALNADEEPRNRATGASGSWQACERSR